MAVKVKSGEPKEHSDAGLLSVSEGHLIVEKDHGAEGVASVAFYAPGVWLTAVVEDSQPK